MTTTSYRPVVCIGESMALVVPSDGRPLAHSTKVDLTHAGAEANVAIGLSRLGSTASWASRLGDDPLGHRILSALAAEGVETDLVVLDTGHPTGLFLKDPDSEGSKAYYYRNGSAASYLSPADVDRVLNARPVWLHVTGVTSALSPSCRQLVLDLLAAARKRDIPTSFDVNYRPALWRDCAEAATQLHKAATLADVVLVGLDEATALWGGQTAQDVRGTLPTVTTLVVKDGGRQAVSFHPHATTTCPALTVDVVEPVGAGDAFAAGWIHARITGLDETACLRLGHLMASIALRSHGDHGAVDDPEKLISRALAPEEPSPSSATPTTR